MKSFNRESIIFLEQSKRKINKIITQIKKSPNTPALDDEDDSFEEKRLKAIISRKIGTSKDDIIHNDTDESQANVANKYPKYRAMLGDDNESFEEKRFKVYVSYRIEMGRDYLDESQASIVGKDCYQTKWHFSVRVPTLYMSAQKRTFMD